jgi:hypothetical protein
MEAGSNKEPTHQICFCTVKSLYALELVNDKKFQVSLDEISAKVIETIIENNKLTEQNATDIFLTSTTYAQLATESTLLWQKPWQEIYEMFKEEFNSISK